MGIYPRKTMFSPRGEHPSGQTSNPKVEASNSSGRARHFPKFSGLFLFLFFKQKLPLDKPIVPNEDAMLGELDPQLSMFPS